MFYKWIAWGHSRQGAASVDVMLFKDASITAGSQGVAHDADDQGVHSKLVL